MSESPRRPARHEAHRVRGLMHRVVRWGPDSRDPIVLLHGWMDTAETFQFLVDELPGDWSFAAPDWRGYGGTEWPAEGDYWFPDYFADLEGLLAVLSPQAPARIIGHSMGGNIAALYAGIRPQRLRWLANLEGFGLPRTDAAEAPVRYARWLDEIAAGTRTPRYASLEKLAAQLLARNPRLTPARAAFLARAWTREREGAFELAADPRHRRVNPVLYRREEALACWRAATIPILLVLGEHSEFRGRLGPDGTDEALRGSFQCLELVTLAGVGHMLHHESPAAVAAVVQDFVQRHEPAPRP
jgi:pimeloyl-ACP methyl ester carboxylesterase